MKRQVLFCVLIVAWLAGNTQTVTVCKSCGINNLPAALATDADTVRLKPGTYPGANLELLRPVVIIGEPGVIIDGGGEGYVLKLLSDHISISNLKIINAGRSYTKDYAAIYTFGITDFVIEDVVIEDPFFGILIEKSKRGVVRSNLVLGNASKEDDAGNGIHLWHCAEIMVASNEVYGLRDGIYLEFVDDSQVVDNHAHHNIRYTIIRRNTHYPGVSFFSSILFL